MSDDRPEWLADGAEIVVQKGDMMVIHSPDGPGEEYIVDTGTIMVELSSDEMRVLDSMMDSWFFDYYDPSSEVDDGRDE